MRGSMLVPRAMRSSVPSPRTLVLVNDCSCYKDIDTLGALTWASLDKPKLAHSHDNQKRQNDHHGG